MAAAIRLAQRARGLTSPNPIVGAVLVKQGQVIGRGWHHSAGEPHAEIEALRDAQKKGHSLKGATLYVTLEPCSTYGRTPPCTQAIVAAGIKSVIIGATDPNPAHRGEGFSILKRAGIAVRFGIRAEECSRLNEAFNYWIVQRRPFVTVKAAMTLDGKIATASGESKWITGPEARAYAMKLRLDADAILVGVNTILLDNPRLTFRGKNSSIVSQKKLRRIILDSFARTPPDARVISDTRSGQTTVVVSEAAPGSRVKALADRVRVVIAPVVRCPGSNTVGSPKHVSAHIDLDWLLTRLGSENVTSLLVEGGGEVNASFLLQHQAQRVGFFYAPKVLGGRDSRPAVGGDGARDSKETLHLKEIEWRKLGPDLFLSALVV
jgi:diaminohydroxyphosphoribosylaminopyrimidine deaminase/5-amino-6-(5-phosphoribosylamino)uracil reductase